ncbi:MAG: TonB-dependent receptor [Burkholderiales bacterium]|nr:TonB-dependent receptor [Burkholderiales bacterium]
MRASPSRAITPVALAAALFTLQAAAQQATVDPKKAELDKVVVTGIRATLERSLLDKRQAGANVDVITALEVGKMPDKNLADSLQRVPGVAVRTDYDEAEKVSMRGTNPDMSLILFNGHTVSGGDWYISDQLSSSRSTSLSLMPSSVLNRATVYKTSQANIADGGLAGTINVTTRKPLEQRQAFGAFASVGLVHATLPDKTSPQLNASFNWKNADNSLGVIAQVFKEKRYVRRDSASRFAYGTSSGWDVINTSTMLGITDASLAGTGLKAADLNGVRMPGSMSTEFVEGVRDREGTMMAVQLRVNPTLEVGATGFYSRMNSNNYGRLYSGAMYSMLLGKAEPFGATTAAAANTNSNGQRVYAQIKNPVIAEETTIYGHTLKVLRAADIVFPNGTTPQYIGNNEGFVRDGASASSGFFDLDATWRPNDKLQVKALLSTTKGIGRTNLDQGITYARYGTGVSYQLRDVDQAPFMQYFGAGANVPVLNADGSGYRLISRGASSAKTVDGETSVALDASYQQDAGPLQSVDFGARRADHRRNLWRWAPSLRTTTLTGPDPSQAVGFPADFGSGLGGSFDNTGFYYPRQAVINYIGTQFRNVSPEFDRRVAGEIEMKERQTAFYVQQNLDAGRWSGNVGLRLVRTEVDAMIATPVAASICNKIEPGKPVVPCARFPTAINTAGDGTSYLENVAFNPAQGTTYYKVPTQRQFDHVLPSMNLRWEPIEDLIVRLGISKTVGRQNYNLYGAGFTGQTCNAQGCTVNGPNPGLKPMTAHNTDVSVAWFYAKRSLLQLSFFDSLLRGYAKTGTVRQGETIQLTDPTTQQVNTYFINTSSQQRARIQGWELGWEQPLWGGFGFTANASLADTAVEDGRPMAGASRKAANLGVYFENDLFSVRVLGNYRGDYVMSTTAPAPTANSQGLSVINGVAMPTAPTIQAPVTNVALHANWNITKALQLSFSGTNLTNPARAQYRYSELEPQKVDSSGRQYYLELRYKH